MSSATQVEPGRRARYRASHHAATNPIKYMMPYQCTRKRSYAENRTYGNGDGIDVRIGEHARYFKLSLTRQK